MKFPKIPCIDNAWDSVSIETLSPSTFSWVNRGCGYQVLLQKALNTFQDKSLSLPSNRNAILGTIIHKIYELTIKGELRTISDLKDKWEELVLSEKIRLSDYYPTLRNAAINDYDKRNSAIRYAMGIIKKSQFTDDNRLNATTVYSEKRLDCPQLGLKGIADKLVIDNGAVDIVDYKSGLVVDDNGDIKTEYIVQLHLYAAMCQHLSLGNPRHLSLVDIDGVYHSINYSSEYCEQLLTDVKDAIHNLSCAVKTKRFKSYTKPELGMCPSCSCRHICAHRFIPKDTIYQCISGIVIDMPSTNMYVLQCGNYNYFISGLDAYSIDASYDYIGKQLIFVNIIRASKAADEFTYRITENTLVYEQL